MKLLTRLFKKKEKAVETEPKDYVCCKDPIYTIDLDGITNLVSLTYQYKGCVLVRYKTYETTIDAEHIDELVSKLTTALYGNSLTVEKTFMNEGLYINCTSNLTGAIIKPGESIYFKVRDIQRPKIVFGP